MTDEEIDAAKASILNAIKDGVKRVTHGDVTTEYQSVGDMLKAIEVLEAQRENASGTTGIIFAGRVR